MATKKPSVKRKTVKFFVEIDYPDGSGVRSTCTSTWRQGVKHLRELAKEAQAKCLELERQEQERLASEVDQ